MPIRAIRGSISVFLVETKALWNSENFSVGRILRELAGAETLHIDHVVGRVGAEDAVRIIGALSYRILVTGWHGWRRWRCGLGAVGRIVIRGIVSLVAVVGRTRITLIVRALRVRAVRTVGLRIHGQRNKARFYNFKSIVQKGNMELFVIEIFHKFKIICRFS